MEKKSEEEFFLTLDECHEDESMGASSFGGESLSEDNVDEAFHPPLVHLSRRQAKRIKRLLKGHGAVVKSLFDLQQI